MSTCTAFLQLCQAAFCANPCEVIGLGVGLFLAVGSIWWLICMAPLLDDRPLRAITWGRTLKLAVVVYAVLCLGGAVLLRAGQEDVYERVLPALMQVESSGGRDTRDGDGGRARGPYQIHEAYWSDACRVLGVTWPYRDARDPVRAAAAVRAYTMYYARHYEQPLTPETIARIHNGGPAGWRKPATLAYWVKVRAALNSAGE